MVGLIEEHLKRGKRIDEKFLNEIFSWVLEREVSPHDVLRVRHPNYIQELFDSFYDKASQELRTKLLTNLEIIIIQTTPYNGKVLSRDKELCLIHRLLTLLSHSRGVLFDKTLQVIHILIAHSMSIENVKQYFTTLYHIARTEEGFLTAKSKFISSLQVFHKTIRKEVLPQTMFDFDGLSLFSGLLLPPLPNFPKSYSFSLWFKSETFINPNHSHYSPRLLSFFSSDHSGLEVFFVTSSTKSTNLQIQSTQHGKVEKLIVPFKFMPKRWYHLTISHTYSLITKSELICYIDGTEVYKGGLKFPSVSGEGLTMNYLFTSHTQAAANHNSFFGQSTGFYYFKDALNVKEVNKLFKLGVGYALNQYTKKEFLSREPIIAYSPLAILNSTVFDLTPELYDRYQKKRSLYNASLVGGGRVINSESIQDSIFSAGGLDLLLPLFILPFDHSNSIYDNNNNNNNNNNNKEEKGRGGGGGVGEQHRPHIGSFHAILVDFLVDFIHLNDMFKYEMVKRKGFKMIRHLLQRSSPWNLTLELLEPIKKLEKVITSTSKKFKKLVFKDFFFQFSLWAAGSYEFQLQYLSFLAKLSINSSSLLKKAIGVQEILDILQTYYWYSDDPSSLTGKIQTKISLQFLRSPDLSLDQIFDLRQHLLCILKSILSEDFSKPDAQSLIRFLFNASDQGQIEDLLAMILSLLLGNKGEVSGQLEECGSLLPFFSLLLKSQSERTLVLIIRIIGTLWNMSSSSSSSCKKAKKIMMSNGKQGFQTIAASIQPFPFSYSLYVTLLEVATDRITADYRNPRSKAIITSSPSIRTPEFLDIMFSLLPLSPSPFLKEVLDDFTTLLYHNHDTVAPYFISHPLFIKWIMALFTKYIAFDAPSSSSTPSNAQGGGGGGGGSGEVVDVYDTLIDLFAVLFHHSLITKDGWKSIEMLVGYLGITVSQNSDPSGTQEIFFFRLIESLSQILSSFNDPSLSVNTSPNTISSPFKPSSTPTPSTSHNNINNNNNNSNNNEGGGNSNNAMMNVQVVMQNLGFIGCIIDEYIFSPIDIDMKSRNEVNVVLKRGKGGKWRDYQMALDLLSLIDVVLFSPYSESINNDLLHSSKSRSLYMLILRLTLICLAESYRIYDHLLPKPKNSLTIGSNKPTYTLLPSLSPSSSPSSPSSLASNEPHESLLDVSSTRIHQLMGKIGKTYNSNNNNTQVIAAVWTLSYLLKVSSYHKWQYKCYDQSISRLIKATVTGNKGMIESYIKLPLPDLSPDTSYFALEKFIQSVHENSALISEMERVKNDMENEMASLLFSVYDRRLKKIKELSSSINDSSLLSSPSSSSIEPQIEEIKQEYLYVEINRRVSWLIEQSETQSQVEEHWNRLFTQLSHSESYPWLIQSFGDDHSHWKLDSSEDNLRRRWRMVLNYDSSDYHQFTWSYIRKRDSEEKLIGKSPSDPSSLSLSSDVIHSITKPLPDQEDASDNNNNNNNYDDDTDDFVIVDKSTVFSTSPFLSRTSNEKTVITTDCDLISPLLVVSGKLHITNKAIYFFADHSSSSSSPSSSSSSSPALPALCSSAERDHKWSMTLIKGIHRRRYLLRNTSLEIFFTDRTNVMLDLPKNIREKIISSILSTHPPNLTDYTNIKSAISIMKSSSMTSRWQKREISNFEYLMYLNTVAGRTYNDLSQYPIFPWIITDYESENINLENPEIYRDLSKPVGALNPKRLADYIARYDMLGDDIPRFFYGSHYSTALVVLYYLIRMEPYTSYYIQLQGRFDHAERIFDSIPTAWKTSYSLSQDVKELIPEFFYLPTFLRNENNFDMGEKQTNGERISDVNLPPWAKGSAEEFVRINAAALESEIVSSSLHLWIDLIFGHKQKGKDAVEAKNVFYYLTYEGAVNIDKIEDPIMRKSTIAQILSFGQTPSQLFTKPHPSRSVNTSPDNYFSDHHFLHSALSFDPKLIPSFIVTSKDKFLIANEQGNVGLFKLQNFSSNNLSDLSFSPLQQTSSAAYCFSIPPTRGKKAPLIIDIESKILISFGHWDGSFRLTNLQNTSIILQTIHLHKLPVQCMDHCEDSAIIACGSADCNVSVWKLKKTGKTAVIKDNVFHLLRGHQSPVTSVVIHSPFDVIVSGGEDGSIITHTLFSGEFIRSIKDDNEHHLVGGVDILAVTSSATIVAFPKTSQKMVLYSLNGKLLAQNVLPNVNCVLLTDKYIVALGKKIDILLVHNLQLFHSFNKFENDEILCASFLLDQKFLLCGLKSSSLHLSVFS